MIAVPISLKEANAFVERLHRHHNASVGDKYRIGAFSNGKLPEGYRAVVGMTPEENPQMNLIFED